MKITLQINKSLEQNAAVYFEKSKHAKKKMEGARKAIERFEKQHSKEKSAVGKKLEKIEAQKNVVKRKKKWYEKFRWFYSSEGFLVIGGRDATTNEIVIKKHTEEGDIVCHTDMSGSPFFVVKKNSQPDKDITEKTIQEAIDATFIFSRAWKLGLATVDTFWVRPDQVSKKAQSGEYLPKGAFMIRGNTNYLPPSNKMAIGAYEDTVMAGPISAVKKHCKEFLVMKQGVKKPSDCAKKIRRKLGGELDDIISALPPGKCEVTSS
ncbi:MAG: NFACT RNA binding domain-containing protein [Candidatus Nanoarchaeia archaeon]